jgi:phosphatidylinositol 4-kinase
MEDPFKESFAVVDQRTRKTSEYASYKTFSLKMMIVKANDDLRQECLAMQLMNRLHQIFESTGLKSIYLRPYEIFITSSNSGMIEFIPDTIALDSLKKRLPKRPGALVSHWNLKTFY